MARAKGRLQAVSGHAYMFVWKRHQTMARPFRHGLDKAIDDYSLSTAFRAESRTAGL